MALFPTVSVRPTGFTSTPDGRRVMVTYNRRSDTFRPKTLKRMIEVQARWNEDDLRRLDLLR